MLSGERFAARAGPVILPRGERFAPGAPGEQSASLGWASNHSSVLTGLPEPKRFGGERFPQRI